MKRTFSGAASGVGAVYEWEGNKNIGKGRMEIAEASPPSKVTFKLDFIKPFEAHNIAEFTLDANGDATDVTWAIYGPSPLLIEGDEPLLQHGQHDRPGVRDRSRQPEDHRRSRKMTARHSDEACRFHLDCTAPEPESGQRGGS